MMPLTETAAAVIRVAAATRPAATAGVHPERARLVLAERHHVHPPAQEHERREPQHRSGRDGARSPRVIEARLPSSQKVMAGSWL